MYSIYSWPNTVQPFIGGILIDRFFGLRSAAVTFCFLIAVGTAIVAAGATWGAGLPRHDADATYLPFYIAVAGRFVFGLGGESLTVTQNTFIARWFSGRELATAFAITLSFSRIGSALNFIVEKPISNAWGFHWALWASAVFCGISTLAGVQLGYLDRMGERAGVVGKKAASGGRKKTEGEEEEEEEEEEEDEEPKCSDIGKVLRLREILIYTICMSFYVAVFVFITIASPFFQRKFHLKPSVANSYVAIPYTVSACISPFLGFAIDWVGYSAQLVFLASCSLAAIHVCFAVTTFAPFPMMIWMGVTYSLCAASLWPMVALIVPIKQLGTAYGLMTALQNLGLAVAPLAVGPMVDDDALSSYVAVEWIFAGCGGFSAFLTLCLMWADGVLGRGLLYASSSRIRKIEAKKVKETRARSKERARRREARAAERMLSGEGKAGSKHQQQDNLSALTTSWQSTFSGTGTIASHTPSDVSSPGGGGDTLFSPKTTIQLRSDYFRRLDILLRRKGGLS
jgi:MFS family permease